MMRIFWTEIETSKLLNMFQMRQIVHALHNMKKKQQNKLYQCGTNLMLSVHVYKEKMKTYGCH